MDIKINIPDYSRETGFLYKWEAGFELELHQKNNSMELIANKAGLISLANHLLNLAQDDVPLGYHLHFDENNSLKEGSVELIIQKI